jgi:hypothetical protein
MTMTNNGIADYRIHHRQITTIITNTNNSTIFDWRYFYHSLNIHMVPIGLWIAVSISSLSYIYHVRIHELTYTHEGIRCPCGVSLFTVFPFLFGCTLPLPHFHLFPIATFLHSSRDHAYVVNLSHTRISISKSLNNIQLTRVYLQPRCNWKVAIMHPKQDASCFHGF